MTDARGELLAQLPKWKAHLQKQVDDGSVYCGHMPDARAVLALIEMIERRAAPVPQCDAESDTLRKALIEARAALQTLDHMNGNSSGLEVIRGGKTIGSIIDAALVSPPSEAGREMTSIEERLVNKALIDSGTPLYDLNHRTSDAPEQRSGHPSAEKDAP